MKLIAALVALVLIGQSASGMVLWNLDNSENQSDPGTGVPWGSVFAVTDANGELCSGSAVYLGNGYLLTANHVTMNATYKFVTFNGVNFFEIDDTFQSGSRAAGKQVASGEAGVVLDMAVFKLKTIPGGVQPATLLSTPSEEVASATMVGWGVGRAAGEALEDPVVSWGNSTTSEKRWGVNTPRDLVSISYGGGNYTAIRTVAGGNGASFDPDGLGNAEAAATLLDSGSGLFQEIGGTWYLIGLTNTVDQLGGGSTSTFGDDKTSGAGRGDGNYFTRISDYDAQILATIPEPATAILLGITLLLTPLAFRRSRKLIKAPPSLRETENEHAANGGEPSANGG